MTTSTQLAAPRAVLIVNPTAGRGRAGKQAREIETRLRQYGLTDIVWRHTTARGHACTLAREAALAGAPLVVAVGGDGTLHEVVNGILGTQATLGLIPFGTGNDFARALGLHGDLDTACRAVAQGGTRRVDIGTVAGRGMDMPRHFLVICGTGYVAQTARTVNAGIRFLSGAAAYVLGAILTLRTFQPFQLTLTLDDGAPATTSAMFVSLCNTETTGGGMKIAPGARADDGLLDICLVGAVPKSTLLYQLTQVFAGRHVGHPAVRMLRASRVSLDADPPQPLLIDGEVIGITPATVTLARHALAVKVAAA